MLAYKSWYLYIKGPLRATSGKFIRPVICSACDTTLLVTQALLMRPGIGQNKSFTLSGFSKILA